MKKKRKSELLSNESLSFSFSTDGKREFEAFTFRSYNQTSSCPSLDPGIRGYILRRFQRSPAPYLTPSWRCHDIFFFSLSQSSSNASSRFEPNLKIVRRQATRYEKIWTSCAFMVEWGNASRRQQAKGKAICCSRGDKDRPSAVAGETKQTIYSRGNKE